MTTEHIELLGMAFIPLFLVADLVYSYRKFTTPRFWRLRAFAVTGAVFLLSIGVAVAWGTLLAGHSLIDGSGLGTIGGAVVGILVYELFHYGYHRLVHGVDFLWRWNHQMHHSAESLDAFGANYLHPLDAICFATINSLVFFPLLGLTPTAGAIGAAFLTFNAMFQHANIKTPHWLGYLIQRPESHCLHHQRGVHRYNYSDLPLWDMVFGTFRNPPTWEGEVGFYPGASTRLWEMLVGRDVTNPRRTSSAAESPQAIVAPMSPAMTR
jgi:sterol desaturase/sphingolipid hydroxylase (fatty acid hydroxylase superfamily)